MTANRRETLIGLGVLGATSLLIGTAPPPTASDIEGPLTLDKLHAHRLALGTPAMGAGWQRGSGPATVIVDGLRSAQATKAVTPGDQWHMGSITKSMTALIAARAVEAGLLEWDSSIGSVLGSKVSGIHPDYAAVTLLHLLSHRSGLPSNAAMNDLAKYSNRLTAQVSQERLAMAQSVLSVAPDARPGSKFAYANAGFVVAGTMLEVLTGKPWEALIREHVFRPLGLHSGGIGLPGHAGKVDQPMGHRITLDGKREAHFTDLAAVLGPAGLTHMSIADMLRYLAAHRDQTPRLLKPESWNMVHTAPFGGFYALGWMKIGDTFSHTGSNGSWLTDVSFNARSGVVAAFASNDSASMRTNSTVIRAAARAAGG
jgi:CubicO group peptidase (beta-lactamase class C family)